MPRSRVVWGLIGGVLIIVAALAGMSWQRIWQPARAPVDLRATEAVKQGFLQNELELARRAERILSLREALDQRTARLAAVEKELETIRGRVAQNESALGRPAKQIRSSRQAFHQRRAPLAAVKTNAAAATGITHLPRLRKKLEDSKAQFKLLNAKLLQAARLTDSLHAKLLRPPQPVESQEPPTEPSADQAKAERLGRQLQAALGIFEPLRAE